MEDERISKIGKWSKVAGVIVGGLTTILTPILVMYMEVKPDVERTASEAKEGAETGYEAVIPALVEMQDILNDAKEWAEDTDEKIDEMLDGQEDMSKRLARCEAYIDILSRRRDLPQPPDVGDSEPIASADIQPDIHKDDPPVQRKATYQIPADLSDAKVRMEKRKKRGCPPTDPLCGELE